MFQSVILPLMVLFILVLYIVIKLYIKVDNCYKLFDTINSNIIPIYNNTLYSSKLLDDNIKIKINRILEIAEILNIRIDCDKISKIDDIRKYVNVLCNSVDAKYKSIDEKINATGNEVHENKMISASAAMKIEWLYNDRHTQKKGKKKLKTAKNQEISNDDAIDIAEVSQE